MSSPNLLLFGLVCCLSILVPPYSAESLPVLDEDDLPEVEAPWSDENDAVCTCCDPPVRRGDVITDENELQAIYMKMKPIEFSIGWVLRFFGLKMEPGHIKYSKWLKKSRKLGNNDLIHSMLKDILKQVHSSPVQPEQEDDKPQDSKEEEESRKDTVLAPTTIVVHTTKTSAPRKRFTMPVNPDGSPYDDALMLECAVKNQLFEDEFFAFLTDQRLLEKNNRIMCFLFCIYYGTSLVNENGKQKKVAIKSKILLARGALAILPKFLPKVFLVDNPQKKATLALNIIEACLDSVKVTDEVDKKNKCAYSYYLTQCVFTHDEFDQIRNYIQNVRTRVKQEKMAQLDGASKDNGTITN
ncbi:uncharacterized protein LOC111054159 [Nilaparvata lugens]|uniref:uncharacterized protein LOC111054159 n=1 Tax=Nilaparvata lugens TaxID=108931 RepID=UPI00193DD298|nr:uncharacterized protein LOC111054159 [Nilaparvata lugens]